VSKEKSVAELVKELEEIETKIPGDIEITLEVDTLKGPKVTELVPTTDPGIPPNDPALLYWTCSELPPGDVLPPPPVVDVLRGPFQLLFKPIDPQVQVCEVAVSV
jgi:hypothetical protein